ncbi:MAG: 4-alpha-glucanotransferase [Pirellulaceae bacterium]|nr:4-alpha-glucanotransferase [Planctomycetales bacterium]
MEYEQHATPSFLGDERQRQSGLLLHVTSLPSPHGIGDLGPQARRWVDYLHDAQQRWWQILPVSPIGPGNSPYEPLSTFAGNVLLISPDDLVAEGFLAASDIEHSPLPNEVVDFDAVLNLKLPLLQKSHETFLARKSSHWNDEFSSFCHEHAGWLDDYALFYALHDRMGTRTYLDWPDELVNRDQAAMDQWRCELAGEIDACRFRQFLFFRQWRKLKEYARAKDVQIIGDLPFFVSPNSSDVWAHPELFLLDERRRPIFRAGVPPDYFSENGQLWGNPIYDWSAMENAGYRWWIERIRHLLLQVSLIRLDHFRAFAAAWHVPATAETAKDGEWREGPGAALFHVLHQALGALPFIAEDLGLITKDVRELRDAFHFPGMRVLQFAFDGTAENPFLPARYTVNSVAYTGTHDNNTTRGWYQNLDDAMRQVVWQVLQHEELPESDVAHLFMEMMWQSRAALAIAPLQDLLNLGAEARMNVPGEAEGNWLWRCPPDIWESPHWQSLRQMTVDAGRAAPLLHD